MIHVYHGESTVTSRKELQLLKDKTATRETITLDGKTVTTAELLQATESQSLFGSDRLVIVENLFSKRLTKKGSELDEFATILKRLPVEAEVVFWEEKELSKKYLDLFPPKTDRALFRPDRALFAFVESVKPRNTKQMVGLFTRSIEKDSVELVFAMLIRQVRYMIMVKDGTSTDLAPWQSRKLTEQAHTFTMPQLLTFHGQLLDIDATIKSGASAFTLVERLQLLVVSL